jgi:hypothetical protein
MVILTGFLLVFSGSHLLPMILSGSNCKGVSVKTANPTAQQGIALIDQLGFGQANPAFADNLGSMAKNAGYDFDYYPSGAASMDFFVNLPDRGYQIIILRIHGTGLVASDPAAIVTSDHYSSSQHVADQLTDRVTAVDVNGTRYFALEPSFVSDVMCGRFSGTLVLAMFCAGTQYLSLAKAFVDKGAGAYIGWNGVVTVSHSDQAFESLVSFLLEGKPVDKSIQDVMTTVGPDPLHGATLQIYSQSSLWSDSAHFWQEYWYIISGVIATTIAGLFRIRNTPGTGTRQRFRIEHSTRY